MFFGIPLTYRYMTWPVCTYSVLFYNKVCLLIFQTHCPSLQVLDLSNVRTVSHTSVPLHIEKLQTGCPKLRVLRITNSELILAAASLKEQVSGP